MSADDGQTHFYGDGCDSPHGRTCGVAHAGGCGPDAAACQLADRRNNATLDLARPDAATLRERIEAAVERTQWPSTGSDQVDRSRAAGVADAVMAVLADAGLVERE